MKVDVDKFLRFALGVAALLGGVGIFYHYVVYAPSIEREKNERLKLQQQQRSEDYRACMATTREKYKLSWSDACKSIAAQNTRKLKNCLETPSIVGNPFMGSQWCNEQYGDIDSSEECLLPSRTVDRLAKYYSDAKKQCETDVKFSG
jgi:hypothetical protein